MSSVFLNSGGIMRPRFCQLLVAALLLFAPGLDAQQITGRVTTTSGEPLAAVQVFIAGSGIGALTQQNGRFLLLNVPAGTHTISAERIGYRSGTASVTVAAGETVVQDFQLAEQALGLDEIIVTGTPGGTQRRAIGNSVTSLSATEVTQRTTVSNVQDLLGPRTPGAQFGRITGNVGTGAQVVIRGMGSFSSGGVDPLVYVDGVRVNNSSRMGPVRGDQREVNPLMEINPAEREHRDHQGARRGDAVRHRSVRGRDPDHHEAGRAGRGAVRHVGPARDQLSA
jgi:hypothetical protein